MVLERKGAGALLVFIILFLLTGTGLLAFRTGSFDVGIMVYGLGAVLLMLLAYNLAALIFRHIDRITLVICFFLASVGLIVLARLDMAEATKQLIWLCIGCLVMFVAVVVIKRAHDFGRLNYFLMAASFGLLAFAYLFGDTTYGAKNWVNLGFISFQPSEIAKVMFIIVSAYFFRAEPGAPKRPLCRIRRLRRGSA